MKPRTLRVDDVVISLQEAGIDPACVCGPLASDYWVQIGSSKEYVPLQFMPFFPTRWDGWNLLGQWGLTPRVMAVRLADKTVIIG